MLAVWTNLMVMIIIILTLSIPVGCFVKVVMFSSALTILLYVGVGVGSWMSDFFKSIYFDWVLNLWVQWQSHGAPSSTRLDICLTSTRPKFLGELFYETQKAQVTEASLGNYHKQKQKWAICVAFSTNSAADQIFAVQLKIIQCE